ncbi:MAG: acyltransferase [Okeania sp.]|nr:acyltransferase [Okeania sp.]
MELIKNSTVHCEYQLSKFDTHMGVWPYYGVINWYKHQIDSHRLKIAIQQIVNSVPILGGRLVRKLFSTLKVVCNPQKSGVGFIEIDLGEQEINLENLLDAKSYVKNEFNIPKNSSDAINQDTPLLYVILNHNQNYYGVSLLINHFIADGGTYFKLLEYLSQAYEDTEYVANSEPLFTIDFQKIDDFIATNFKKLSWQDKILSSTSFIVFVLNSFFQNQDNWSYLECILTKEKLDLIKRNSKNLSNEESAYSTNDALFEFLSVVPIKRFIFLCNLRYRNVGIPKNYLGNAEAFVLDLTKPENNYMLKHTDVRKSVNELPRIYGFISTFDGKYLCHNSWVKLQNYSPGFGGKLIFQKFFEFDDIPKDFLSFACQSSGIYKLTENQYLLICINLKNVVSQIEKKLKKMGVEEILIKTS